jgi:hypothetical protein
MVGLCELTKDVPYASPYINRIPATFIPENQQTVTKPALREVTVLRMHL